MAGEVTNTVGVLFKLGTGASAPYTYATVGEVETVKWPKVTAKALKYVLQSTATTTYIPGGVKDVDEGELVVVYKDSDTFYAAVDTVLHGQIEYPNGVTATFDMIVTSFDVTEADAESPEVLKATIGYQPCAVPEIS